MLPLHILLLVVGLVCTYYYNVYYYFIYSLFCTMSQCVRLDMTEESGPRNSLTAFPVPMFQESSDDDDWEEEGQGALPAVEESRGSGVGADKVVESGWVNVEGRVSVARDEELPTGKSEGSSEAEGTAKEEEKHSLVGPECFRCFVYHPTQRYQRRQGTRRGASDIQKAVSDNLCSQCRVP
jgi:hypothetical protein